MRWSTASWPKRGRAACSSSRGFWVGHRRICGCPCFNATVPLSRHEWGDTQMSHLMSESFSELFEQSLANQRIRPGQILTGRVVSVSDDMVIVNVGLKSEAV